MLVPAVPPTLVTHGHEVGNSARNSASDGLVLEKQVPFVPTPESPLETKTEIPRAPSCAKPEQTREA